MTPPIDNQEIRQWLDGTAPSAQRVEALARLLPWWTMPAAMRLRNAAPDTITDTERRTLGARLAASAPDLDQMTLAADRLLDMDLGRFYPVAIPGAPDTATAIDKFISTYGTPPTPADDALLERLILNPAPDYAQLLAREEEHNLPHPGAAPAGSPDDLINSFIIKSKASGGQFPPADPGPADDTPPRPQAPARQPRPADDTMLSESLARAYIRRGKYTKAYEIITGLNLNFPEKSIYFADQLRFLRKLIALEERRTMLKK